MAEEQTAAETGADTSGALAPTEPHVAESHEAHTHDHGSHDHAGHDTEPHGHDSAVATATEGEEPEYQYVSRLEDAGPATKKVFVEIPQTRIAEKLAEQFKELRKQAAIPGFRAGHAPQKLVEKRFASDVREQVRRDLISESYRQALEKHSLTVVGDPEFDDPAKIELPAQGDLKYAFNVEVQPDLKLPTLTGIKVKKPKISVTEEHIDQAMTNLRQQNGGALVPVEDRGVTAGDYLVADVHFNHDGKQVMHQHDAQFVAGKTALGGVAIDDLADKLAGAKAGEKREWTVHIPTDHPLEAIRDKDVQLEVAVKDIRKLDLPVVDKAFLESLGFENEKDLRDALAERLDERIRYDVQQAMREQVGNYLLEQVQVDVPAKLSERQATRMAGRRAVELQMRGMTRDQVMGNIQALKNAAQADAAKELKLFFILQKLATEEKIEVDEGELNSQVAMLAARQGRRPEKVKHEMAQDGSLAHLYVRLREEKALDMVLETAEIEEVEPAKAGSTETPAASATEPAPASPSEPEKPTDAPTA
ncbi:MAG: trigger factor [Tepidisphaeraceae bacterium]